MLATAAHFRRHVFDKRAARFFFAFGQRFVGPEIYAPGLIIRNTATATLYGLIPFSDRISGLIS